jgi:anaerobic dimethyl sulfoxide reductase subunit B (iron-sulfur subunit)
MSTTTTSTTTLQTGVQYGFFYDQSRCVGCYNCHLVCKSTKQIPPGQVRLLRLFNWETGSFPNVSVHTLFAPCYHCENPVCVGVANGALIKEPSYGAVLIDPAQATSANLKAAWEACPYGAISFDSDAPDSTAYKCDMCIDRLATGQFPSCVLVCPTRALDFGPLTDLQAKYGTNADLDGVPSSTTTSPAVVFKAMSPKQTIVPYDTNSALTLLGQRGGSLPPVYTDPSVVTNIPAGSISRTTLNMKAAGSDLMLRTMDDD